MKRQDPQLRSLLAAEYALGTLRGRARARFERMLEHDAALRDEVAQWDARFYDLMHSGVTPQTPDPRVLESARARLGLAPDATRPAASPPATVRPRRRRRWSLAAAAAVLVGLVVLLMLPERIEHPEPVDPVAEAQPVTTLALDREAVTWQVGLHDGHLVVWLPEDARIDPGEDADYELWWVGDDAPISLGVLPRHGAVIRPLHADVPEALTEGALAVSLEARGGSVTGEPAEVLQAFPL